MRRFSPAIENPLAAIMDIHTNIELAAQKVMSSTIKGFMVMNLLKAKNSLTLKN